MLPFKLFKYKLVLNRYLFVKCKMEKHPESIVTAHQNWLKSRAQNGLHEKNADELALALSLDSRSRRSKFQTFGQTFIACSKHVLEHFITTKCFRILIFTNLESKRRHKYPKRINQP